MPFVRVEKLFNRPNSTNIEKAVRMSKHGPSKSVKFPTIYFAITRALADEVGWQVEKSTKDRTIINLDILEGTGKEAGFLMLMPNKLGYAFGASRSKPGDGDRYERYSLACSITASSLTSYTLREPDVSAYAANVDYTIDGNSLLVQCPDWLI